MTISTLDEDGDGIANLDGRAVTVPGTIPGERAEIEWRMLRDGRAVGRVVRLVETSPHRVKARCRHFGPCGGCTWQHIAYPEQLRLKQRRLQDLLDASLGRGAAKVLPTLGTPPRGGRGAAADASTEATAPWQFRNKVHFVFGPGEGRDSLVMGHYRRGSRSVIPIRECPVHAEPGNALAFQVRDALLASGIPGSSPDGDEGIARHVVIRVGEGTAAQLVTLIVTENIKPLRGVSARFLKSALASRGAESRGQAGLGLHLSVHDRPGSFLFGRNVQPLAGLDDLREPVGGIQFIVGPASFFQTNVRAAEILVREVVAAVGPGFSRVLDLYSGVGLFGLPLAAGERLVRAVEENREAVQNAHATRRLNRVPERAFTPFAAPVEQVMDRFARDGRDPWDVVVMDPPRSGCPPVVLDWVYRRLQPRRSVYVSCNPEALARDLREARAAGYTISRVQPVDMFPHTAHLETVVVMERKTGA